MTLRNVGLIGLALALAISHYSAYRTGKSAGLDSAGATYEAMLAARERATAAALAEALEEANAIAAAAREAERTYWAAQARTDTVYKIITRTVKEYVEATPDLRECGLDADGLRLWNTANAGGDSTAPTDDRQ